MLLPNAGGATQHSNITGQDYPTSSAGDAEMRLHEAEPRASGGPVKSGELYKVGEQGPEWFIPDTSGFILPNMSSLTNGLSVGVASAVSGANPVAPQEVHNHFHVGMVVTESRDFKWLAARMKQQTDIRSSFIAPN